MIYYGGSLYQVPSIDSPHHHFEGSLQSISLHDLFCYTVSSSAKFEVCYEFMLLMEESVGGEGWVTGKILSKLSLN